MGQSSGNGVPGNNDAIPTAGTPSACRRERFEKLSSATGFRVYRFQGSGFIGFRVYRF